MKARTKYLVLAVLGLIIPYSQFLPWLWIHGLDVSLFFQELFSNRIGGFFGWDVFISAYVLIGFMLMEGRRLMMRRLWLPVLGTCLVGVSFGLPLFLYMRHPHVEGMADKPSVS